MDENSKRLRELLEQENYPSVFFYKFIVKNNEEKIAEVKRCFSENAEIELHPSRNGNYVSVSIKEMMLNVDDIFLRYERVSKIDDVIAL